MVGTREHGSGAVLMRRLVKVMVTLGAALIVFGIVFAAVITILVAIDLWRRRR